MFAIPQPLLFQCDPQAVAQAPHVGTAAPREAATLNIVALEAPGRDCHYPRSGLQSRPPFLRATRVLGVLAFNNFLLDCLQKWLFPNTPKSGCFL